MNLDLDSATAMVGALARRELSSRELVAHFVDRIEHLNPRVNALVTVDAERALAKAAIADAHSAHSQPRGPLHGLPVTIKDALETRGLRTSCGVPDLAGHVPDVDADAVQRLTQAGAIVLAKSNTPTYAGDIQTSNPLDGLTHNPWDLERTVGGSSGGSAAAIAAGMSPLDIGSDLGGSIRLPAHFCGVFGLKTTRGMISARGHIPHNPGALHPPDVSVLGPLGRTAEDLRLAFDVLAGPPLHEGAWWTLPPTPPTTGQGVEGLRFAACLDDPALPVDHAVATQLGRLVDQLRHAGAEVHERDLPVPLLDAVVLWDELATAGMSPGLSDDDWAGALDVAAGPGAVRWARAATISHRDWLARHEQRLRWRAMWTEALRSYDALLLPVAQVTAFPHQLDAERWIEVNGHPESYWSATGWCAAVSGLDLPAVAVPAGLATDGLPVGVQVVGTPFDDRRLIEVARRVSQVVGAWARPGREVGR